MKNLIAETFRRCLWRNAAAEIAERAGRGVWLREVLEERGLVVRP